MSTLQQRLGLLVGSLALALQTGTAARADMVKIDFSGAVDSFLFYDSPLLNIGDPVSGTVFLDYPSGTASTGQYTTPAGTTTITGGGGRAGSVSTTSWFLDGTGPSGTFGGLYYTLDDLVLTLPVSVFAPPPVSDVLALSGADLGVMLRTSQITDIPGGGRVESYSYAAVNVRSATITGVNPVPDSGSTGVLAGGALAFFALARRLMPSA